MTTMTRDQGELIANFIHSLRPDWGTAGIIAALYEARQQGSAAELAIAAIRAAGEPSNRTPAVIALTGPHWLGLQHHLPVVRSEDLCHVCSRPQSSCERQRFGDDDHEFQTIAAYRACIEQEAGSTVKLGRARVRPSWRAVSR